MAYLYAEPLRYVHSPLNTVYSHEPGSNMARLSCSGDFYAASSAAFECSGDVSTWPTCTRNRCLTSASPPNTAYSNEPGSNMARLSCSGEFYAASSAAFECSGEVSTWPTCTRNRCLTSASPANTAYSNEPGSNMARLSCSGDFYAASSAAFECSGDVSTWPTCSANGCSTASAPTGGQYDAVPGTNMARLMCTGDYFASSSAEFECTGDGASYPTCTPNQCSVAPQLPEGQYEAVSGTNTARLTCPQGSAPSSSDAFDCSTAAATWPTCARTICDGAPAPDNGRYETVQGSTTMARLVCNDGFVASSAADFACEGNVAMWPTCAPSMRRNQISRRAADHDIHRGNHPTFGEPAQRDCHLRHWLRLRGKYHYVARRAGELHIRFTLPK